MSKIKEFNFGFEERRIAMDEEHVKTYRDLKEQKKSPFYQFEYTKIFIAAMAIGFKKNHKVKLKKRVPNLHGNVFSKEEKWLMISLFMNEHNDLGVKSLFEPDAIFELVEQYANGGIKYLATMYSDSEEPLDDLETEFRNSL